MQQRGTVKAGLHIEKIPGPLSSFGDVKSIFKLKYFFFDIENDATKALGQDDNAQVIYNPAVFILPNDKSADILHYTYGAKSLGDCEFYYFSKFNGKPKPVLKLKLYDCLSRYATEINTHMLNNIKTSDIKAALYEDRNLSFTKNLQKYISNLATKNHLDYDEEVGGNYGFMEDNSKYILLLLFYTAINLTVVELDLNGVAKGNTSTKINCWET